MTEALAYRPRGKTWTGPREPLPLNSIERRTVIERYRSAPRTERCDCGGVIVAGPSDREITEAVRLHQSTPGHRNWWAAAAW